MLFKVISTNKRSVIVQDESGREMILMKGDTLTFNIPRSTETTERPFMTEPKDMTLADVLEALAKNLTEHDLDCEEGGPKDRCPVCLVDRAQEVTKLISDE